MNYQVHDFLYIIEEFVKLKGKPHLFVRNIGPNKCSDVSKLNEVYSLYRNLLPFDIFTGLFYNEFFIVEFDTSDNAINFLNDNFPKSPTDGDPDYYIYGAVYNEIGQEIFSNGGK